MSAFHSPRSSGAPTFTAVSANLSLSGLDDFAPLADPDAMDAEWYHSQDHYHHPKLLSALPPAHEPFASSVGFSYPAHTVAASEAAFAGPHFSPVDPPMNGHAFSSYNGAPRLDDLTPISPLQPHYNPNAFQPPYPDSTASSAPSDDPIIADAEEDKRKRNQAASARFRQKKKQREQQMLEQSRDIVEKNKKLEGELESMKRENTFLRKLLVEKVDNMNDADRALLLKTTKDVAKGKA